MSYKPVIGLEVHVELKTKSKMFCGCSTDYFGKKPNTHVCPTCFGLPGALPTPNKIAIEWCIKIGLSLNCDIPLFSKFDRKNYFYPDLPKGYQISQYDLPFAHNGFVKLKTDENKTIRIRRVHMEEDTGKLIHGIVNGKKASLIDFNRSGVPLVEIVTEPDFESAEQVNEYLQKLQQIIRYLEVSDADMEKGQMRLEPNISLKKSHPEQREEYIDSSSVIRRPQNDIPTYKVEVKNINSFRFVEKAIHYETERQRKILEGGKTPVQETRGWDEKRQITFSQRIKEQEMDYRYFPEADIPPFRWTKSQISRLRSQIPEMPDKKLKRFNDDYSMSGYYSEILTRERKMAEFFEETVKIGKKYNINAKKIANTIINKKIDANSILPAALVQSIIKQSKKTVVDEEELKNIALEVFRKNPKAVDDYKKGKNQVIGFIIGMMKREIKKPVENNQLKEVIENLLKIQ